MKSAWWHEQTLGIRRSSEPPAFGLLQGTYEVDIKLLIVKLALKTDIPSSCVAWTMEVVLGAKPESIVSEIIDAINVHVNMNGPEKYASVRSTWEMKL